MNFEGAQTRWNKTKPIRGRNTDVRPIGERRRTWERIDREAIDEGMYVYHAVLYNTRVITWYPNGDIVVRSGGWQTPSTAEFIHTWSPFSCRKAHNKLWVDVRTEGEHPAQSIKSYPIGDELRLNYTGFSNVYRPAAKVIVQKQVVNRAKAKEARAPLQPFLSWAKAFLTLSDGWVMHETRKQALGWDTYKGGKGMTFPLATRDENEMYKMLTEQAEIVPEDTYLRVLCSMAPYNRVNTRQAETHEYEAEWFGSMKSFWQTFDDYQLDFDMIKRKVYAWVAKHEDVHDIVEVEAGSQPIHGTV